ncbi:hypothetical protein [Salinisphaera sp.]|uniref:hypothetical protein n=1 Tax=Salinisphaera sp. TaxID=1914330 RepID=UPI0025F1019D|nr:hypothetical protein [Salinisphaera sp.]
MRISKAKSRVFIAASLVLGSSIFASANASPGHETESSSSAASGKSHGASAINSEAKTSNPPRSTSSGPRSADDYDVIDHSTKSGHTVNKGSSSESQKKSLEGQDHTDPQAHIHAGPHNRD